MAFLQETNSSLSQINIKRLIVQGLVFIALLFPFWLVFQREDVSELPVFITDSFTFTAWVNQGEDYLKEHYRWITRLIASYVKAGYFMLEDFLLEAPWVFVVGLLLIPSLAYGGIKLGLLILFGFMYWGMVGLWESAMETLALMGLSVVLSVIVGVMLGILCALSDRFEKGMKPVLDTMQVMPAFVYLIPAMFFFRFCAWAISY